MSSDSLFEKNPKIFVPPVFSSNSLEEKRQITESPAGTVGIYSLVHLSNLLLHSNGKQNKNFIAFKTKLTFTIQTISNKRRIARTVVWALGISARCIRMAFVHFEGMGLAAFVNVWERTYIVKKKSCWRLGQIRSEKNIQSLQESASHSCKSFFLSPFHFFLILAFATNLIREIIWFHQLR